MSTLGLGMTVTIASQPGRKYDWVDKNDIYSRQSENLRSYMYLQTSVAARLLGGSSQVKAAPSRRGTLQQRHSLKLHIPIILCTLLLLVGILWP